MQNKDPGIDYANTRIHDLATLDYTTCFWEHNIFQSFIKHLEVVSIL